jgi:hypothetical protein
VAVLLPHGFEAWHDAGGLLGMSAGAELQEFDRQAHPQLRKESIGHVLVVLLPSLEENLLEQA